ncbi:MAG: hypothetical protein KF847_03580 [Pirellulales bacterium]|nr:hypothetical protein [Pirellulales bacterium]
MSSEFQAPSSGEPRRERRTFTAQQKAALVKRCEWHWNRAAPGAAIGRRFGAQVGLRHHQE